MDLQAMRGIPFLLNKIGGNEMKESENGRKVLPSLFAGIDVSQEWFHVAVVDSKGKTVVSARKYDNTGPGIDSMWNEMQTVSGKLGMHMAYAMESSGIYHIDLLAFLSGACADVTCLNPLSLSGERQSKLRKTKTDELDCGLIAEYMRKNHMVHEGTKWSEDDARLRERTRVRQRLIEKKSIVLTQMRRDLDMLCPGLSQNIGEMDAPSSIELLKCFCLHSKLFSAAADEIESVIAPFYTDRSKAGVKAKKLEEIFAGRKAASGMEEPLVDEIRYLIAELELIYRCIGQQEIKIEKEMEKKESVVSTVPGIGSVTAAVIEAEIGDPHRFGNEADITAFAGLDSAVRRSGKYEGEVHISKRGSVSLRTALVQASLSAVKCNPSCAAMYDRLIEKGKHRKVARIAVARKLLLQAWSVMKNGKAFEIDEGYLNGKAAGSTA